MNSTVAEAPRPARDQRDGRSPGSRVSAACRLPDLSLGDRNQWHRASARRLQLRGQPWVGIQHLAVLDAYHIPSSLSRSREAIKGVVQRCALPLSMASVAAGLCSGFRPALLSLPAVCINLNALSGARTNCMGLASETGIRCERESAFNSGTAPATVSESRRISWSLRRWRGKTFRRPKAFASPETGLTSSSG
ncbi:MAG: hypothetical protein QOF32_925 [Gammaproteobacteria bacterium]|nr:hypothetical protein [Gammaproteobacteria bacterium]